MSQALPSPLSSLPSSPLPVPVTIIAGFLGSGKTSLLNHLLSDARGCAITALVNDFGALNIDSELIAARHGNQIALANGCVCCSIGDDLVRALVEVMQSDPHPDHIIIEASGVADPARIAGFTMVDRALRLNSIIALVDALAHATHANDLHLADNYQRQICAADFFLISKTDIATSDAAGALAQELRREHPATPQATVLHGVFPADILLGFTRQETDFVPPAPHPTKKRGNIHDLRHWSGHIPPTLRRDALVARLCTLAPHVLRAKGVLHDADGAYVLHLAGGRFDITAFDKFTSDRPASGHFVLIGKPELPDARVLAKLFCTHENA